MGLYLNFMNVFEGKADVVGDAERGVIHHDLLGFKGKFRQGIGHFCESIEEIHLCWRGLFTLLESLK